MLTFMSKLIKLNKRGYNMAIREEPHKELKKLVDSYQKMLVVRQAAKELSKELKKEKEVKTK